MTPECSWDDAEGGEVGGGEWESLLAAGMPERSPNTWAPDVPWA